MGPSLVAWYLSHHGSCPVRVFILSGYAWYLFCQDICPVMVFRYLSCHNFLWYLSCHGFCPFMVFAMCFSWRGISPAMVFVVFVLSWYLSCHGICPVVVFVLNVVICFLSHRAGDPNRQLQRRLLLLGWLPDCYPGWISVWWVLFCFAMGFSFTWGGGGDG